MKNYLENQMKIVENRKIAERAEKTVDYNNVIKDLKKYDQETVEKLRKRRSQLNDQVIENFNLAKRKYDVKSQDKVANLISYNEQQSYLMKQANQLDSKYVIDLKKMRNTQKQDMIEQMRKQELIKQANSKLAKLDHVHQMDGEFDLIMKNQERYKKKIEELTKSRDQSPFKNLAIVEKEREKVLVNQANQSFIEETRKRNKKIDELAIQKQKLNMDVRSVQKQQIESKNVKIKNQSSLEILNDKIMLDTLHNHEQEMILKERLEDQNRRMTFKKFLDDQADLERTNHFASNPNLNREFELNRELIKEISQ